MQSGFMRSSTMQAEKQIFHAAPARRETFGVDPRRIEAYSAMIQEVQDSQGEESTKSLKSAKKLATIAEKDSPG